MARRKVSGARLKALRMAWQDQHDSMASIAKRFDIHVKTLTRYAREYDWPARTSARVSTDPAESLHDDLVSELRASLERLRPTGAESAAEARDRLALIRLYQRSLAAVLECDRRRTASQPPGDEPYDYHAAYHRALAWLDSMAVPESRS